MYNRLFRLNKPQMNKVEVCHVQKKRPTYPLHGIKKMHSLSFFFKYIKQIACLFDIIIGTTHRKNIFHLKIEPQDFSENILFQIFQ